MKEMYRLNNHKFYKYWSDDMIEIGINNLKKEFGANKVFENVSFELHTNERIGLIGKNGTGKTTLMKILTGEEPCEGDVFYKKGLKLSYLNQIPEYKDLDTTMDILYQGLTDIQAIKKQMTELEKKMCVLEGKELEKIMDWYSQCQTEFEIIGGYDVLENLSKIITGLDLNHLVQLPFASLSGGEKTRVMLGKVLLENPDVLLLDEPTNHLDINMVSWLENYLLRYKGATIIISHDRYFLDKVVTKIVELHPTGIELYLGNYSYYKVEKEKRYELLMKNFENQQKKIKNMKEQIRRYRTWGDMRDSNKMYRKAKELEKRLDKIEKIDRPTVDKNIRLNFNQQHRSGNRVYELHNLSKGFDNKCLFNEVDFEVFYQDCLAIIGDNGSGKSTLLKLIKGDIKPDAGKIHMGARIKVGYLPQEVAFDNEELTILETYQHFFNCTILKARNALAKVLFIKNDVFKKVKMLSGGERSRLKLLMLMDQKVNVLLLDEPTNHLDIESREILEHSLLSYPGTIIVISHDRYFINQLSNRVAKIDNHQLKIYEGNYDDYLQAKEKEEKIQ